MKERLADMPGIRVLYRLGARRIVQLVALVFVLGAALGVLLILRPDLAHPADLGTDASNYLAAGERIRTGHQLYALSAGDRPATADNPPDWSAPLLSPPPVAVLWAGFSWLPAGTIMYSWWLAGAIATIAFCLFAIMRGSARSAAFIALLAFNLAITAWSANLNAFILPALGLVWPLTRRGGRHEDARGRAAGVLVALTTALKLTPATMALWLLAERRWNAIAAACVTSLLAGALSVAVAGWPAHVQYLSVGAATATVGGGQLGLVKLLVALGAAPGVAALAPEIVIVGVGVIVVLTRDRPGVGFCAAVAGAVLASPVIRLESLAILAAATSVNVNWGGGRSTSRT